MALSVVTAPTGDVLTLAEAKAHLRVSTSGDDALITSLLAAAVEQIETRARRALLTQTLLLTLPCFPGDEISLPRPPMVAVDHVKYRDSTGTLQTVSASVYLAETATSPGRVCLLNGQSWPSHQEHPQAVQIQYVAGYGAAADVPERLKMAIRLQLECAWDGDTAARRRAVGDLVAPLRVHSTPAAQGTL